jgi:glyceraldehyde 3-phosphate dehydrogenase (phosphorylating)
MAKTRVGINGFGRIGRNFFRSALERDTDFELVAFNDLGDVATMAHLLAYDSLLGPLEGGVTVEGGSLKAAGKELRGLAERDPAELPWGDLGVDVVIESTGFFTDRPSAQKHLEAGAKKVIISAPATDPDLTVVLGVNDDAYDPSAHHIISNASCTTNCVAPLAKVLNDAFTIERGFMTTIHAYTNDQNILDLPHKDLRRARAAAINLIPTSTGAARAIGLVLPTLQGRIDGVAVRAPVATGSITDLTVQLAREVTVDDVNAAYGAAAAGGPLQGYLQYSTEPLVSTDIHQSPYSCIFDSKLTMASGNVAKVFGWYDNEWGYSCRLVDVTNVVAKSI